MSYKERKKKEKKNNRQAERSLKRASWNPGAERWQSRWWWRRHRRRQQQQQQQQQQQEQRLEDLGRQHADAPNSHNKKPVSPRAESIDNYPRKLATSSQHRPTTTSSRQRQQSSTSHPPSAPNAITTPPPHNPVAGSSKIPRVWGTSRVRYPAKKRRKKIDFVEPTSSRLSQITLSSAEVIGGTKIKPLKSALRSTTSSLRSSTSSVRFSLPADNEWKRKCTGGKIDLWWRIFEEDTTTRRNTKNWFEMCRCLFRTTYCRLMTCFIFGIIFPSFLIVPVLVYKNVTRDNDTRT